MIKIEVTNNERVVHFGPNKEKSFLVQEAYAHLPGAKYPARVEVSPPKGGAKYAPGVYTFGPDSFYVDQYGKLALGLKLVKAG